jgi:hypothetical protein
MRCSMAVFLIALLPAPGCARTDEAHDARSRADLVTREGSHPREAGGSPDAGSSCPTSFIPCGGDVVGKWSLVTVCPAGGASLTKPCDHPFGETPACIGAGNQATCTSVYGGTITLGSDGKSTVFTSLHAEMAISLTGACVLALRGGSSSSDACASLTTTPNGKPLSCAFSGETCRCTFRTEAQTETMVDSYQISGTDLMVTPSASGEKIGGSYCITGDELVMRGVIGWAYWVLRRAP